MILTDGNETKMATIREEAVAYKPKGRNNIADLDKVSINLEMEQREDTDKDNNPYTFQVALIEDEEYRVPGVVLRDLKVLLEDDPNLMYFKVLKTGSGKETKYAVIPVLEGT